MRLSHAILLGDSLKHGDAFQFMSRDGSCGCAFGGAILAIGATSKDFWRELCYQTDVDSPLNSRLSELPLVKKQWPWLRGEHIHEISRQYARVHRGLQTLEQLCDYVRSIEPSEPDEFSQLVDVLKEEVCSKI